jgi:two-component system nitrate/nitrite response regulator NarL
MRAAMQPMKSPNPKPQVRILLADDDPLVRAAVGVLLSQQPDFEIVAEAHDGEHTISQAKAHKPEVLLLDLNMPRKAGLETLRDLGDSIPNMKTVVLTLGIEKRQVLEALQLGARGIVLKENAREALVQAIRTVGEGSYWLDKRPVADIRHVIHELSAQVKPTPAKNPKLALLNEREVKIVNYIVEGRTNKDIAQSIETSEQVVKNHLGKIFDKLGVFNRLELALYALDNQLVERRLD